MWENADQKICKDEKFLRSSKFLTLSILFSYVLVFRYHEEMYIMRIMHDSFPKIEFSSSWKPGIRERKMGCLF